jgi:hypothetical protein
MTLGSMKFHSEAKGCIQNTFQNDVLHNFYEAYGYVARRKK